MAKTKNNSDPKVDVIPNKYPKPVKSYLTIYFPGGGSKEIEVEEVSNETIQDNKGEEWYTGVPPDLQDRRKRIGWKTIRMHHALHGLPFTFQISSGRVISDVKKNSRLIEQGRGVSVEFDNRSIVVLVDLETQEPKWREEHQFVVDNTEASKEIGWKDLEAWIKKHKDDLDALDYLEFPVLTAYDVSEIEFLRSEFAALIESKAIEKTLLSMENLGKDREPIWYVLMALVTVVLIVLIMMFFANEGVFDKRDPLPQTAFRLLTGW